MRSVLVKQLGYTLITLSISLSVMGIIMGAILNRVTIYYHDRSIEDNRTNVDKVVKALDNYVRQNGVYPCPAKLNVDIENNADDYGMPVSQCNTRAYNNFATDGYFIKTGTNSGNVIHGAVPFRVLNLMPMDVRDFYGMRLEYAVTGKMTDSSTYNASAGEIEVYDAQSKSIFSGTIKGNYIVISHGRDKVGAYSDETGLQAFKCDASYSSLDILNCGDIGISAIYRYTTMADIGAGKPNHFDDIIGINTSPILPLWLTAKNNSNNIWFDTTFAGGVEIGYPDDDYPVNKYASTPVSSISKSAAAYVGSVAHGLNDGDVVYFSGARGMTGVNNQSYKVLTDGTDNFYMLDTVGNNIATNTAAYLAYTTTTPGVVTKIRPFAQLKAAVTVNGDVRATGNLYTQYICDASTNERDSSGDMSYCFKIDDLAKSTNVCPGGSYAASIDGYGDSGVQVNCVSTQEVRCPIGKVITGITAAGLTCDYPPKISLPALTLNYNGCTQKTMMLCGSTTPLTLSAAINGATSNVTTLNKVNDSDYNETYRCVDGEWAFDSSAGTCDGDFTADGVLTNICTSAVTNYDYMDYAFISGDSPLSGFSGKWNVDVSNQCKDEYTSDPVSSASPNDIKCEAGEIKKYMEPCAVGSSGCVFTACDAGKAPMAIRKKTWICDSSTAGHWSAASNVSSDCIDMKTPTALNLCPEGLTYDSGSGTCLISSDIVEYRTRKFNCGLTINSGLLMETRTFNSTTKKWSQWLRDAITACDASNSPAYPAASVTSYTPAVVASQAFTLSTTLAKALPVGDLVHIYYATTPTIYVDGSIIASTTSTVTVKVTSINYPGTGGPYTNWVIELADKKWTFPTSAVHSIANGNMIGPVKDKGSPNRLGDACYDNIGVQRSCYSPAGSGHDTLPLYYQFKDCTCQ